MYMGGSVAIWLARAVLPQNRQIYKGYMRQQAHAFRVYMPVKKSLKKFCLDTIETIGVNF